MKLLFKGEQTGKGTAFHTCMHVLETGQDFFWLPLEYIERKRGIPEVRLIATAA
jgi:hypothetical protein